MTEEEYRELRKKLTDTYRADLDALDRVYAMNGTEPARRRRSGTTARVRDAIAGLAVDEFSAVALADAMGLDTRAERQALYVALQNLFRSGHVVKSKINNLVLWRKAKQEEVTG